MNVRKLPDICFLIYILHVVMFGNYLSIEVPCNSEQVLGQTNLEGVGDILFDIADSNATILIASVFGTLSCFGAVTGWAVKTQGQGKLHVQVWRPVKDQPNTYLLLGQNLVKSKTTDSSTSYRNVPEERRILVDTGDIIAIRHDDVAIVGYESCDAMDSNSNCGHVLIAHGELTSEPGSYHVFDASSEVLTGRRYAITAYLDKKSPASCEDREKTISDTLETGDHVINVRTQNVDLYHLNTTIEIDTLVPELAVYITTSGEIVTSGMLVPEFPSTVHVLTIHVSDLYSGTTTCLITLTVKNDPKPVTFTSLPAMVSGHITGNTLHKFCVSRQRIVDDVTCYVSSTIPTTEASFGIIQLDKTAFSVVNRSPSTHTDNDVTTVVMVIACNNSAGLFNQSTLAINFGFKNGKSFWLLFGLIGLFVSMVTVFIILACLIKKGKLAIWPNTTQEINDAHAQCDGLVISTSLINPALFKDTRQCLPTHSMGLPLPMMWNNYLKENDDDNLANKRVIRKKPWRP